MNDNEHKAYESGMAELSKAELKAGLAKEKQQDLPQFHESFSTPFDHQPFDPSESLRVAGEDWHIEAVYKKEGVETDLTTRLVSPTLDEYWYRVKNDSGATKWCVVTNTKEVQHKPRKKRKRLSLSLKRMRTARAWFEVVDDSANNKEEEQNAILIVEPPYLKENERKFDVTDTLFKTTRIFEKKLGDNLTSYAYEYLAGVRLYVFTDDGEMEMDIFAPTVEEALAVVQEQFTVSIDEQ